MQIHLGRLGNEVVAKLVAGGLGDLVANLPLTIALKLSNPGGFLVVGLSLATDAIEGGAMNL